MFENKIFDVHPFEQVPLNRDVFLMDETYMTDWERAVLPGSKIDVASIGYITPVAVRKITANSIELSWYADHFTRFQEVSISLPRSQFLHCVGSVSCDEKPHIFVKSGWLEELHKKHFSIFGLVDAEGMREALQDGKVTREKLVCLRKRIDALSRKYPQVAFISFADSVLLKANWNAGYLGKRTGPMYAPEMLLEVFAQCRRIFLDVLGIGAYGIFTQGANEYYKDKLIHKSGNHVCLNTLGSPFAQLFDIDRAVRKKTHPLMELYLERHFYRSLRFDFAFDREKTGSGEFTSSMSNSSGSYFYLNLSELQAALKAGSRLTNRLSRRRPVRRSK